MIELKNGSLEFSFSKVHPEARLSLDLMRTLRIPDDDSAHLLPPGLGQFPLRHVDDFGKSIPGGWVEHGGIVFPMYQSEAMWLSFSSDSIAERQASYPFAIKIATGKIDAVTGEPWRDSLHSEPQDYVVSPTQPWLDGYCVEKGIVRQFVAMPLGGGYTAEEQVTGEAGQGGGGFIDAVDRHVGGEPFQHRDHAGRHVAVKRIVGRRDVDPLAAQESLHLVDRFAHRDAQVLGFLGPGDDAAVVVGQHDHRAALQARVEHPLARGIEVVDVDQTDEAAEAAGVPTPRRRNGWHGRPRPRRAGPVRR